jgi:hypothetical protein
MIIPRHIFREYDIRGVVDRDLGDDLTGAARAASRLDRADGRFVVDTGNGAAPLGDLPGAAG